MNSKIVHSFERIRPGHLPVRGLGHLYGSDRFLRVPPVDLSRLRVPRHLLREEQAEEGSQKRLRFSIPTTASTTPINTAATDAAAVPSVQLRGDN